MPPHLFSEQHSGVRCHHEQGMERTVCATQRTEHMKELADEMASWVSDADRQLEQFVASLGHEVIVDYPVNNATVDEFEHWLGLSLL